MSDEQVEKHVTKQTAWLFIAIAALLIFTGAFILYRIDEIRSILCEQRKVESCKP